MHHHFSQSQEQQNDDRAQQLSSDNTSLGYTVATANLNGSAVQRRAALLQMQRQHGNAYVRRHIASVQREYEAIPSVTSDAGSASTNQIGDGSASVSAENGVVTINAAAVNINAPLTNHSGVDRSSTVITDSVIAASYSPGAGNIW